MIEVCVLTEKDGRPNWCEACTMFHNGHYRDYALDPGPKGQKFREYWRSRRHIDKPLPGIVTRVRNYLATLTEHVANGSRVVPLPVRDARLSICEPCEHRNRKLNACSLCGCSLNVENMLGDKLSWEVASCPDGRWSSFPDASSRHLLFHLWPRKVSMGTWQRNLDQLKLRWNLFNGRRVIAVVTGPDSHDLPTVQAYMRGYDCEWETCENDASLREVKTFPLLFRHIEGLPGYTFYAQSKGVTKPVDPGVSVHPWTAAMYELNLDYWPRVEQLLKKYPVAGCFKKVIYAFDGSRSSWHYSGSFCWLRNDELWKRDWRAIEQVWYGIETWPSMIYGSDEAGVVFFEQQGKQFNLYERDFWQSVEGKLKAWRRTMAPHRSGTGSLTTGTSP